MKVGRRVAAPSRVLRHSVLQSDPAGFSAQHMGSPAAVAGSPLSLSLLSIIRDKEWQQMLLESRASGNDSQKCLGFGQIADVADYH